MVPELQKALIPASKHSPRISSFMSHCCGGEHAHAHTPSSQRQNVAARCRSRWNGAGVRLRRTHGWEAACAAAPYLDQAVVHLLHHRLHLRRRLERAHGLVHCHCGGTAQAQLFRLRPTRSTEVFVLCQRSAALPGGGGPPRCTLAQPAAPRSPSRQPMQRAAALRTLTNAPPSSLAVFRRCWRRKNL